MLASLGCACVLFDLPSAYSEISKSLGLCRVRNKSMDHMNYVENGLFRNLSDYCLSFCSKITVESFNRSLY